MSIFKGFKDDDTILWFIILFVLLFFCNDNGRIGGRNDKCGCDSFCD